MNKRENWGSRLGFLLAAAGSAVGLGNIWRFPYMTGENGGGAFLIIYLVFVILIGVSVMVCELAVGRRSGLATVGAYKSKSRSWTFAGVLGVLCGLLIMGFYPVIGGWSLAYIFKSISGLVTSVDANAIGATFDAFITSPIQPLIWTGIFLSLNAFVVVKGVSKGIEKASKILMPMLLILLTAIAIYGFTLPGASEGLSFLFKPDFSAVTGETYIAALGQAFFSLSIGMGCMITYGSYLKKDENLVSSAGMIVSLDVICALLAGLAIFPALFAFGLDIDAGPGLVFVVVPTIFANIGGIVGIILAVLFFIALSVAALTSSVSLLEGVVAYLIDEKSFVRKNAVTLSVVIMLGLSIVASLSMGVMSDITLFGVGAFDFLDILTDKIFLAVGGLLLVIFAGWHLKKEDLKDELTNGGSIRFGLFDVWYFLIKYIIPVAIAIVVITGAISIEQTSLMVFGLGVVLVLGIFSKKL